MKCLVISSDLRLNVGTEAMMNSGLLSIKMMRLFCLLLLKLFS